MCPTERCEMAGTIPRLIASAASFRWVQMGDGPPTVARILAGQGEDRAGILGAVGGRRTGARGISQAFGDTVACAREPTPPRQSRTVVRAMPRRMALGWMPTPSLASSTIRARSATRWAQVR